MSVLFFFFKQKTAYEMRISDWSSDVCSSDLYHCGKVQDFPSSGFSPHQSFTRSFFMCDSHRHHETTTTAAAPAGAGVTFHVSDMTCGHCAGVIRSALEESLPGAAKIGRAHV